MNPRRAPGGWAATPVRRRLTFALVLGLAPVLIVGALQSYIASHREAEQSQSQLAAAAERSAATARARIEAVLSAGAGSVHVFPLGTRRMETVRAFAECWRDVTGAR